MKVRSHSVGITFGLFAAAVHALWSLLVLMGLAEIFMTWILGLHFLDNPYVFQPFSLITALTLIIVAFIGGYLVGYIGGTIWNWAMKK